MLANDVHQLRSYVIALELEVDRLRRTHDFLQTRVAHLLGPLLAAAQPVRTCEQATGLIAELDSTLGQLVGMFRDLRQPPGYHPALDQVVAIAVRPIIEQVFRAQQRLLSADNVSLHLELAIDYVEWFPVRLRHLLDNLLGNAIRFRDAEKGETRVLVSLRNTGPHYELRVSDNGVGFSMDQRVAAFDLMHRMQHPQVGVGLAVVKLLVEESGGTVAVASDDGHGSCVVIVLPRFDKGDYLETIIGMPVV